jgi:RHS repeat-associated protein
LRFPGQCYDAETGLHYNYFRDYDPKIGRYVQSDPIGLEGGLNIYAYALANPSSYIDPNGLEVCGKCAPGSYDCLIYGGNVCENSNAPSISEINETTRLVNQADKTCFMKCSFFEALIGEGAVVAGTKAAEKASKSPNPQVSKAGKAGVKVIPYVGQAYSVATLPSTVKKCARECQPKACPFKEANIK